MTLTPALSDAPPPKVPAAPARDIPHALALVTIAALGLPLLLILLGAGDTLDMMELFNLVPAREAFRDGHWLMPTLNGVPRLEKPPLAAWAPAAVGWLFGTDSLWAFRLPAALMGLVTTWSVYGIGCVTSKDRRLGLVAAVITLTSIVFLRHARLATYDIFSTGFLTLGMFGLFGMVEAARDWGRRALWALLAGAGIGLSILSKGPVPVATVCVPFGVWLLIYHRGRTDVWLGLILAAAVSLVFFVPWLVAVGVYYRQYDPWGVWYREILQNSTAASNNPAQTAGDLKRPFHYYLQFFGWVAPHVPLVVAGLALPFLKKTDDTDATERRGRVAFWAILVGGLLILSLLAEKKPRYAMPLFPFAGLLAASAWQAFWRADGRKPDLAGAAVLVVQHMIYTVTGGVFLVVALLTTCGLTGAVASALNHPMKFGKSFINPSDGFRELVALASHPFPAVAALAAGLVLAGGVAAWRAARRAEYARAAAANVLVATLMVFCLTYAYRSQPENYENPVRPAAEKVAAIVGGAPLLTARDARPWLSTLYYVNRVMPEDTTPASLAPPAIRAAPEGVIYYLLVDAPDAPSVRDRFGPSVSAEEVFTYQDEKGRMNRLFRITRTQDVRVRLESP